MDSSEADLAPASVQQVRPVLGAVQPKSERAGGVDVRRRVKEILAGRPVAVTPIGVEARDPLEERAAVGGGVAEVALLRHRLGVLIRCRRQGGWKPEGTADVAGA